MNFTVLTIFPDMVDAYFAEGMIRKATEDGIITASALNIRDFAEGKHRITDDKLYGGGCGMVMKPEPLSGAIAAAKQSNPGSKVIYLTPQGRPFDQAVAQELSGAESLIFICGRYEGIDERVCQQYVDEEISIGSYVLTGGELAAMVVVDAVVRLLPGVLGGEDSAEKETFSSGLVEHAQYTRPPSHNGLDVPPVLLSGNHAEIERWRLETSLIRTFLKRPDLFEGRNFSKDEKKILRKWSQEIEALIAD